MPRDMRVKLILPFVALLLVAALVFGYLQMSRERASEAQSEKPVTSESKESHGSNGEVLSLDEQTQKLVGLESCVLSATVLPPEIKCYGRVLDASPLIALLSNVASAQASLEASAKDYQRVKGLFNQGQISSARALETAEAATRRDQVALQAAEAELVASWGKSLADQSDLPTLVQSLARQNQQLLRLDLPAGEMTEQRPLGARLVLAGTAQPIWARFVGPAATTEAQVQGQGFLFLATNTPPLLSPGLTLTGFIELPGQPLAGVTVPEAAVVRSADRAWVYVQTDSTNFTRRELNQAYPVPTGWVVTSGLKPNDRLVTTGSQVLLSEERKSEIKAGD